MAITLHDPRFRQEWLLTNSLGGYAMGTVMGTNTRRYHGLLTVSLDPPGKRRVTLHSTIDQFHPRGQDDDYFPLSTQIFGPDQTLHPQGGMYLEKFHSDTGVVSWTWNLPNGVTIQRDLRMEQSQNSCSLTWTVRGLETDGILSIRPLAVLRDHHQLRKDCPDDFSATADGTRCLIRRNGLSIVLETDRGVWDTDDHWWHQFEYPIERERGQDDLENAFCGGVLRVPVTKTECSCVVKVALQEAHEPSPELKSQGPIGFTTSERLAAACEPFVVTRGRTGGSPTSIIAGYPWFMDWGRDSLISLPGLLLAQGRTREAASLLRGFGARIQRGIVPNRFGDNQNQTYYNTADASLWFINATYACFQNEGLTSSEAEMLVDCCRDIVRCYRAGTDYGIQVDYDGLLIAGVPGAAVTWMDARVNGVGVTARIGKPVELSALWYNALLCLANMVNDPDEEAEYRTAAALARKSFRQRFWNESASCCYDVLLPGSGNWRGDDRIRPNQIFAVGLPFPTLEGDLAKQVVDVVREHLLTPYGLRTLSPTDVDYRGRYEGDQVSRDTAYHNGTCWPWLLGPFCDAVLATSPSAPEAADLIRDALRPIIESMNDGCLGQIAEIYDGDSPQRPHGCPAQAWSVAEINRSWIRSQAAEEPEPPTRQRRYRSTRQAESVPTD